MRLIRRGFMKSFVEYLKKNNLKVATAESLTGGLVSDAICQIPGASSVFEYGVVTYSNEVKTNILGVDDLIIKQYGAVSRECVSDMARLVCQKANADIGLATSGVAGPDGLEGKAAGTVFIAVYFCENSYTMECHFKGDRNEVRKNTVEYLAEFALSIVEEVNLAKSSC